MISLNVVVQLIKRAASRLFIACTQNNNNTALFHGAECGRAEVVKLLLDKGANIEAKNFASPAPARLAPLCIRGSLLLRGLAARCFLPHHPHKLHIPFRSDASVSPPPLNHKEAESLPAHNHDRFIR